MKKKKKKKREYKTMAFSIHEIYIVCDVNSMCICVDLHKPRRKCTQYILHSMLGWRKESRARREEKAN